MQTYIVVMIVFVTLCAGWGVFQLWLGRQADGSDLEGERSCSGCGKPQEIDPR